MKNFLPNKKRFFLRIFLGILFLLSIMYLPQKVFAATPIIIEAETGELIGTEISTSRSGFTGTGYVTGFNDGGDKLIVTANIEAAGTYSLAIRYASEFGDKINDIYVNGILLAGHNFLQSTTFTTVEIGEIALIAGKNTIEIRSNWGWMDVDNFSITPPTPPTSSIIVLEAEDGELSGTTISTDRDGFTGTGYVTGFTEPGDKVTVSTNLLAGGTYTLSIRYASEFGNKINDVYINGALLANHNFLQSATFTSVEIAEVSLNAGENTIEIRHNWGWMDVDNITLTPPQNPEPSVIIIEAEDGILTGTMVSTERAGYTGTGYVTGFDQPGDKITVTTNISAAGVYNLSIRYASEFGDKTNDIFVNGSLLANQIFSQSATFTSVEIGEVSLNAGENTIEFRHNWGWMDVDNFILSPPQGPVAEQIFLEAESATLSGTEVSNTRPGYTGTGYVTGFSESGDKLTINFHVETAEAYTLSVRYASEFGDKTNDIYINGALMASQVFPQSNEFTTIIVGEISLPQGNNTLEVRHNWGWMDFDNFTFTPPGAGNTAPVAKAGHEQVLMVEGTNTAIAILDGSGSTDSQNNIDSYVWKDVNGNVIGNEAIIHVGNLGIGEHVFNLTVTDTEGLSSSANTKIFVGEATNYGNHRLTLRQREDQIVKFISGINLAWKDFSRDIVDFDEAYFTEVFDNIQEAGGNALRWWLHTNGRFSPQFDPEGNVLAINPQEISNMRRALDLAHERGIVISMCLFSFDLLQPQGQDQMIMKNLVESRQKTQTYIDNALIPIINELGLHPAVMSWEIFNEPEGMTTEFGWTPVRTEMKYVQQFINMTAGAIHRTAPGALVSNGSWSIQAMSDVDGNFNYYRDDRLIAAGGDEEGTLDFYQVHFYPQYNRNNRSPFHRPASWWGLDKPIVIAEYPETGVADLVDPHYNTLETFQLAYDYGYAGVMPWDYHGYRGNGFADVVESFAYMKENYPDDIIIHPSSGFNFAPKVVSLIPDVNVLAGDVKNKIKNHADLSTVFYDVEDGNKLVFSIENNTNPNLVTAVINKKGVLELELNKKNTGISYITIKATDSEGANGFTIFHVQIKDAQGNLALFKPAFSSTDENTINIAAKATDGFMESRWSSLYSDPQWIYIDLSASFTIDKVKLFWEYAHGKTYEIQVSEDAQTWSTVFAETNGDGEEDIINFTPVNARYVRMYGTTRGTQWGYSLYEFEVYNTNAKVKDKNPKLLAGQEFELIIYPNPAHDKVAFKSVKSRPFNITIYDATGKLKLNQIIKTTEATIDVSLWNKGIYMVIIQSDEERFIRRIIVE